jgi:hypothetical protein
MNFISIILVVVVALFTHQATAQTVYDVPTVINAFLVAIGITPNNLLATPDNVPVEQDVTFYCANP